MTAEPITRSQVMKDLQALMDAHGVKLKALDGWLVTGNTFPAMRGSWLPQIGNQPTGRLDIQVVVDGKRLMTESFAGMGEGPGRYADALRNFSLGSLHVMLSALWARPQTNKVSVENWTSPDISWKAHVGEFVSRCLGPDEIAYPTKLLGRFQKALMEHDLDARVHWLRSFYSNTGGGEALVEVLLDNERWKIGEEVLSRADWPHSDYYYSLRNFLIIEPLRQKELA
ncbi:MAG: DUF6348 family protein [Pseudomonadota bacterium]